MLPPSAEQTDCVRWEKLGLANAALLSYVRYTRCILFSQFKAFGIPL